MRLEKMPDTNKTGEHGLDRAREDLKEIFLAALDGADAVHLIRDQVRKEGNVLRVAEEAIPLGRYSRIHVVGIGKASAHMAVPLEDILGEKITDGRVIVKYGYGTPLRRIEVKEAGHPLPDARGVRATEETVEMIRACREDDLILFLVSGGGSSLFVLPEETITLYDKIQTHRLLLDCGATIDEINTVRKPLSSVKGGKVITLSYPATLVSLVLSDVIGDRLSIIASGPTVPQTGTEEDPLGIIERYGLTGRLPGKVLKLLEKGTDRGPLTHIRESQVDPSRVKNVLLGNNKLLLEHALRKAEGLGYATRLVTSQLQGEAREEAKRLSSIAMQVRKGDPFMKPPVCLIAGGETTVTVEGFGTGGRCQEFALSAAISLSGERIAALAAGSDGTDGPTNAAGAIVDGETYRKGKSMGLDPHVFLEKNDSHTYFRSTGELLITGPTKTNVMDLYAFVIP